MTKNDIASALCRCIPNLEKSTAINVLTEFNSILSDAFAKGENVYLRGFGTYEVQQVKEKKARNISLGTTVVVPAHKSVKFRLSKDLKKRLNS